MRIFDESPDKHKICV